MYTYNTRVGYSKVDKMGKASFYEIVNYMQDATTFQSEELGVGMRHMMSQGKAWILIANKIEFYRPIMLCEEITVGTAPTDFHIFGSRQYFVKDKQGKYLAKSEALWLLIDLNTRKPIRAEAEDIEMYDTEQIFDDVNVSRKIKLTGERTQLEPFKVLKSYIDSNGHMNNVDYLRVTAEYLPEDLEVRTIQIVYVKEAMEGQTIIPYIYKEEEGMGLTFENEDGQILTKIKIN